MIKEAIEKIVNKGDLTYDEAYTVMNEIMDGETTPTQNAAFLAALSTKSAKAETTDEIAGCAAAMRAHAVKVETDMELFEIVGTEKPLLLVRSDEAHLEAAIRETNAGAAARTTDEAITFIREVYQQWKVQGYTHQAVNKAAVQLFNREAESAQFEQLLLR